MDDIYRLHLSVTGPFAYRTKIDYKNPGQNEWKRSGNLANVSLGISRDVYLKDVSGLQEGAIIRFVMDIRCGKTFVASENFIYKKDSDYYASYNGAGVNYSNPKGVFKGLFPTIVYEAIFKGRISTADYKGEASALFLKVSGGYAYDAKIQYREKSNTAWTTTKNLVNVTLGLPEIIYISDIKDIKPGYQFRFVMDIVDPFSSRNENITANEYFTYKSDTTSIAKYDCKGTTQNWNIRFNGIDVYPPANFVFDLKKHEEKIEKMIKEKTEDFAKEIAREKGIAKEEAIKEAEEEAKKIATEEKFRNFSIFSENEIGLAAGTCVRIENHSLADVMKFKNDGHITSIFSENKNKETRITTLASGPKDEGIGHIWFIDKEYECNEEEVILHGDLAEEQTTDFKDKDSNIIYISWNDKLMGGDHPLLTKSTSDGTLKNLLNDCGFSHTHDKENNRYFYHAKVNCPQRPFGYCDLYDEVFNYATTMDREKFEFTSGGKRYIFWTWKGYYLNLGAGAEMGFYEFIETRSQETMIKKIMEGVDNMTFFPLFVLPFTKVAAVETITKILSKVTDKKKDSKYDYYESVNSDKEKTPMFCMKLTLDGKGNLPQPIYTYDPQNVKQWWITSFVPHLQGVNPKDLAPTYEVYIDKNDPEHMQIFEDFKKACEDHITKRDSIYDWSSWSFKEGEDDKKGYYILTHTF